MVEAVPMIVGILLLSGTAIFAFGYARAVMVRANVDYKKTKEGLPGMRKAFWSATWTTIKVGFWIVVVAGALIVWAVASAKGQ